MKNLIEQYSLPEVISALGIGNELFWDPQRLVSPSSWAGHIATAFWLVKVIEPRVIVELGTQGGNSYSAFCQAVARLGLSSRCFAIDTWEGDEQTGAYGDEVFHDLSNFNDQHFSEFSNLLRMTFDEARAYFAAQPQGEIDLLHIDGLHTYEAARHDFETWRDALSSRAVVVFHGISVRERGFGVWKLWQELAQRYPSFAFDHSEGLGILCIGRDVPSQFARLIEFGADPAAAVQIRALFAARGDAFRRRVQSIALVERADEFKAEISRLTREMQAAGAALEDRARAAHESEVARAVLDRQLEALRDEQPAQDAHSSELAAKVKELETQLEFQRRSHEAALSSQNSAHEAQIHNLIENELRERNQIIQSFQNSTSWRITAPLRSLTLRFRGVKVAARQAPIAAPTVSASGAHIPEGNVAREALAGADAKLAMRAALKVRLDAFLTASGKLRFKRNSSPDVSILLIFYNSAELSYACLSSIAEVLNESTVSAEVLILDNGSSDATPQLLDRIEGATIIRSRENLHFLKGVNRVAKEARGKYLLFLNNDALLLPGSLEAAVSLCDADDSIGAVGGRIILPDGTLQEAGSVVWRNGACTGYGRGAVPDAPEFMFRRDVDYCSGAFLLTPRATFEALDAFDERYAPAYYEETDYCLRLWESGRRVVFDPAVVILHFEFGSSSNSEQALQLQQRNHAIFRQRHQDWLSKQHEVALEKILWARGARVEKNRVLYIEDRVPHENLGSGYPRSRELLCALERAGAELTLFPMFPHEETWAGIRHTVPASVEVMRGYSAQHLASFLKERAGYYDAIFVCRPHNMEAFLNATNGANAKWTGGAMIVYDAESLFASRVLIERRMMGEAVSSDQAQKLINDEISLTKSAKAVIAVSAAEKRQFEKQGVERIYVMGHSVEPVPTPRAFFERADFLFVGGIHEDKSPNADSLRWFVGEVWPHVLEKLGSQLKLHIVGYNRASTVLALKSSTVHLVGKVDDLAPWYDRARIVIAPTRIAAGIPSKGHMAAAHGVPMVTTRLIADQLGWESGEALLAEDDPLAFADACVRLYTDQTLWESVRTNALARVASDCSPQRFEETVRALLAQIPRTRHSS